MCSGHKSNVLLFTELKKNGKSHLAAPGAERCFPRSDSRKRTLAQIPKTVCGTGDACAPFFFGGKKLSGLLKEHKQHFCELPQVRTGFARAQVLPEERE